MKCKQCGAEISDVVTSCPYCDTVVVGKRSQEISEMQLESNPVRIQQPIQQEHIQNELAGKKYELSSSKGMLLMGFLNSKVMSSVEVATDRLYISIIPKKMNLSPVIMLEDVLAIELSKKITAYHIILAVLACAGGFAMPPCFLLAVLFVWLGTNTKITISQRNGINVIMYSSNKVAAEAFKEDMRMITHIH